MAGIGLTEAGGGGSSGGLGGADPPGPLEGTVAAMTLCIFVVCPLELFAVRTVSVRLMKFSTRLSTLLGILRYLPNKLWFSVLVFVNAPERYNKNLHHQRNYRLAIIKRQGQNACLK